MRGTMWTMRVGGFVLSVWATLALTRSISAQELARPLVARGVELDVDGGFGSFFDNTRCTFRDLCEPARMKTNAFAPGPGVHVRAGYRPVSVLAFGLHVAYQMIEANRATTEVPEPRPGYPPLTVTSPETMWTFAFGVYARVYPVPIREDRGFELSVGVGFDFHSRYADVFATTDSYWGPLLLGGYLRGYSFPVDVGLHYYVARGLAIGVNLSAAYWLPGASCGYVQVETGPYSSRWEVRCTSDNLRWGASWFVGTGLHYSFFW